MILLTNQKHELFEKTKICYICEKQFLHKYNNDKNYYKARDHCHYTDRYRVAAHNICNLKQSIHKEIPVMFRNGLTYDYNFIVKELVNKFEGEFIFLGENT